MYPKWVDTSADHNLREVAPNLFVGAMCSPMDSRWSAVIDLYGSSSLDGMSRFYRDTSVMLRWSFDDGNAIPDGLLDTVEPLIRSRIARGPVLIHCQAGLSRSASVAYAMMRVIWKIGHQEALRRVHRTEGFPRSLTLASARAWVHSRRLL